MNQLYFKLKIENNTHAQLKSGSGTEEEKSDSRTKQDLKVRNMSQVRSDSGLAPQLKQKPGSMQPETAIVRFRIQSGTGHDQVPEPEQARSLGAEEVSPAPEQRDPG